MTAYRTSQITLVADILTSLASTHPGMKADSRLSVITEAADKICAAFSVTEEEYKAAHKAAQVPTFPPFKKN